MVNYDYLYDPEYFRSEFEKNYLVEKELSYSVYENAYIVSHKDKGSGVYTEEKEYIDCSALANRSGIPLTKDEVMGEQYMDEDIVYLGVLFPVWGHTITDVIRRFWFLKTSIYLRKYRGCKLAFVKLNDVKIPESIYELFGILGARKEDLFITQDIIQYRKVIIPDDCFWLDVNSGERCFSPEYRKLICEIRCFQTENFIVNKAFEKVYFSHARYGGNKHSVGEEKLEDFFEKQGYKIMYPEEYSLKEQLNILANCHYFASTVGSCSHNIIFLPEHSNVILIPRLMCSNSYQLALDNVVDLNISYVDASLSVHHWGDDISRPPYYYYVSENLKAYFGDNTLNDKVYYEEQFSDFEQHICPGGGAYTIPKSHVLQLLYCMKKTGKLQHCIFDTTTGMIKVSVSGFGMDSEYIDDLEALKKVAGKQNCMIYCAGRVAKSTMRYLLSEGMQTEGVLVTSESGNPKDLLGVSVIPIDQYEAANSLKEKTMIVCAAEGIHTEIRRVLENREIKRVYYLGQSLCDELELRYGD